MYHRKYLVMILFATCAKDFEMTERRLHAVRSYDASTRLAWNEGKHTRLVTELLNGKTASGVKPL